MRNFLKDEQHLVRMAAIFLVGLLLFLIVRAFFIPKGFYEYGHFRAGALADNAARPMGFAGREACESCHPDIVDERKGSRHAAIACEACHGPWPSMQMTPAASSRRGPTQRRSASSATDKTSPSPRPSRQVNPQEHMGSEPCNACHKPHHPEMA